MYCLTNHGAFRRLFSLVSQLRAKSRLKFTADQIAPTLGFWTPKPMLDDIDDAILKGFADAYCAGDVDLAR